jgi:hypothetical protein
MDKNLATVVRTYWTRDIIFKASSMICATLNKLKTHNTAYNIFYSKQSTML